MTLTPELITILNATGLAAKEPRLYQVLSSLITNLAKAEKSLGVVATTVSSSSTTVTSAITSLTGDGTATGPGAAALTLSTTGVTAGSYGSTTQSAVITVDAKGRLTAVTNATISAGTTGITQLTGDVLAGPGTGSQASTLSTTGVTAGTYGSATQSAVVTVDAKGRLTAVTNATITAGSGSGAITLISEVITTGSTTVVTFTSITNSYRDLILRVRGRSAEAALTSFVILRLNSDTGSNYDYEDMYIIGAVSSANQNTQGIAQTSISTPFIPGSTAVANANGVVDYLISDYNGALHKNVLYNYGTKWGTTSSTFVRGQGFGTYRSTAAITTATVTLNAGAAFVNSTIISLYGSS